MSYNTKSKQVNDWCTKNAEKVEKAFMEEDSGELTYWIHLHTNWICPEMECSLIHEWTAKDTLAALRTVISRKEWVERRAARHLQPRP